MKSVYVERTKSKAAAQTHRKKRNRMQYRISKRKTKCKCTGTKMWSAVRTASVVKHIACLSLSNLK